MNDKKDPPKKAVLPGSKRKPPASLFLWLLAFLVLASLIVFQSSPYFAATEEWSANQFLSHLEKGEIVTAEVLPESDKILAISGEFKLTPKTVAKKADADTKENEAEKKDVDRLATMLSEERIHEIQKQLRENNLRQGFACLFYGGPGTGKTETVLQLARATGRDIYQVNISQIKDKFVGESEKNVKQIFDRYRRYCNECEKMPILLLNEC